MVSSIPVFLQPSATVISQPLRRAFSAMSGLETSNKQADGDDDSAEEDEEVYKFLDAVSLSGSGPKSSLIAQKD